MTLLVQRILEVNRGYVARREARPFPPVERLDLAVVACYDPRLDSILFPALGLEPGQAFVFRTAGALVRPTGASLRSLGLAVFMFGVTEIVVVGHAACRMAAFLSSAFIESFRARGVAREVFGSDDLREWAGAIPSPRQGVAISIANIRAAAFLPRDVSVWGAVLDEASGTLEVVVRPEEAPSTGSRAEAEETAPRKPSAEAGERQVQAESQPQDTLAAAVEEFAHVVRSQAQWAHEARQLRTALSRPIGPMAKFGLLEGFARRAGADSKEVLQAFERLEHAALDAGQGGAEELIRMFQQISGEVMSIGLFYVCLLCLGLLYAVIAGAMGWLSDLGGGDIHVDAGGHLGAGHPHPISGTTIATFVTGFGAGGVLGHYSLAWPLLGSLGAALSTGLLAAAAAFGVLELIFKQTQAGSEFSMEQLPGREAEVITPIPAGGTGEVAYLAKGQREQGAARSVDGSAIAKGRLVVIEKVLGSTLYVRAKA